MEIQKILDVVEEKNLIIKDLEIKNIIPNAIDNVIISYDGEKCITILPNSMAGTNYKNWKNSRGGIFFKDVRNYFNSKKCGKYVLLNDNGVKIIARLIEEYELDIFNTLKLINGKIKDKAFMKLKTIKDDILTSTQITKDDIEVENEPKIIITNENNSSASEDGDEQGNVSLFED